MNPIMLQRVMVSNVGKVVSFSGFNDTIEELSFSGIDSSISSRGVYFSFSKIPKWVLGERCKSRSYYGEEGMYR